MSLRERKKRQTRERLRESAMTLFETRGYDQTTVEEIAEQANVSRRTFFRYFSSKDDVIFSTNMDRLARFKQCVQENDNGDRIEAVLRAFEEVTTIYSQDREEIQREQRLINGSENLMSKERSYDRRWVEVLSEELSRPGPGAMTEEEASTAAAIMYAVAVVVLSRWRKFGTDTDLLDKRERPFQIMLEGLNSLRPQCNNHPPSLR